ncbi:cytochrome-c peroxidase [Spirosoma rhododendri]|uniref:Cytochrome c domain-containing protein n=1 Tax=Spirosoma rhododendri TaxID=2728024 RepID=A0A7L5DRG0_9BACT|nr:cytochrome-c peroxidase [Spirosoma rhododendri]QJD80041.1 hypothetical protein HH216_17690 [Spirosoma rhododendri]
MTFFHAALLAVALALTLPPRPPACHFRRTDARRIDARRELGRLLFFDPVLSANYKRSCASCHRPEKAFTDQRIRPRAFSFSDNLPHNTPTILNISGQTAFFHDGRAHNLSEVVQAVITNPAEFNSSYELIIGRLRNSPDYQAQFRRSYGTDVSATGLNDALNTYVLSLSRQTSAYDTYQRGETGLPEAARRGYVLFTSELRCTSCHTPPWFRDDRLHSDQTTQPVRTPGLRNVLQTPPYLHDGSAPTIEAALSLPLHQKHIGRSLTPDELTDLRSFLATLTDSTSTTETPTVLPFIRQAPTRRIGGNY